MRLYINPTLAGASTEDDRDFGLWLDGIYTQKDVANLCATRGMILKGIRDAAEVMDYDRIDLLDEAYDDISNLIELVVANWPADYAPVCLDENHFR